MHPVPANIALSHAIDFCRSVVADQQPIWTLYEPLISQPEAECFSIVPEQVARCGGKQLTGWAIWEIPGVFIEAEFHCVWERPDGAIVDITPRPFHCQRTVFLFDPDRKYSGRQVDNIRHALVEDRDVVRFLYLAKRLYERLNKGDLADQHGKISLSARAWKEYWKMEKELLQLQGRLARRYKIRESDAP